MVDGLTLAFVAALIATLAACVNPATVWVADDLERDDGRYYVTCEAQHDPDNDDLEIQVWVTDAHARSHREGGLCPNGTVRHVGSEVTGYTVGKPLTAHAARHNEQQQDQRTDDRAPQRQDRTPAQHPEDNCGQAPHIAQATRRSPSGPTPKAPKPAAPKPALPRTR